MTTSNPTISHPSYNKWLVERAKELGGKYSNGTWTFQPIVADLVAKLASDFTPMITVEITAKRRITADQSPITFLGYTVLRAFGRDSGARLGDNVAKVSGSFGSSGSVKNWTTTAAPGATFRISVPLPLLGDLDIEQDDWTCVRLDNEPLPPIRDAAERGV